jgi:hypothetical protein
MYLYDVSNFKFTLLQVKFLDDSIEEVSSGLIYYFDKGELLYIYIYIYIYISMLFI